MHTTKLLIGLTLVASMANAQGAKKKGTMLAQNDAAASTVAQADSSQSAPAMTASPATQTSVADAAAAKPAAASKFGVMMAYESAANVKDVSDNQSRALIDAIGAIGVNYKATPTLKLEARHNFGAPIISDRAQLADSAFAKGEEVPYKLQAPTVHANVTTDWSVLGSKPLTIASRYYIPVDKDSMAAGSNGVLRTQTSLDWDLNPKVTLSAAAQARLYMFKGLDNTAANNAQGADSTLRLIPSLSATYNVNDAVNMYYQPYMDLKTNGHQRGNFTKAELRNNFWQEIGMNFTVGAVTINPAYATAGTAADGRSGYDGVFTSGNSEFDLNLYANF